MIQSADSRRRLAAVCAFLLLLAAGSVAGNPLDDYISAFDPNYAYELVRTVPGSVSTTYVLTLTSQKWLTEEEVNHPLWTHWVVVVLPKTIERSDCFLWITGGSRGSRPPEAAPGFIRAIAESAHSAAAVINLVPNQPLVFTGDGRSRVEDEILSFTFDRFMRTGDLREREPSVSRWKGVPRFVLPCGNSEGASIRSSMRRKIRGRF